MSSIEIDRFHGTAANHARPDRPGPGVVGRLRGILSIGVLSSAVEVRNSDRRNAVTEAVSRAAAYPETRVTGQPRSRIWL